jgi:thiamine pyrophosphokinase
MKKMEFDMRAIIFANGELDPVDSGLEIQEDDLIIAADGGSQHCLMLDLIPDVLIGDLDSSPPVLVTQWKSSGVEVIDYPEDKDQTDLELAILYAQDQNVTEILVYGAIGGRLDMTLGNLMLLTHPELETPLRLICGKQEVHLIFPKQILEIFGKPGEIISLIPLKPGPSLVTTQGLEYPLKRESLNLGYTRGISNRLIESKALIELDSGLLALIHIHE